MDRNLSRDSIRALIVSILADRGMAEEEIQCDIAVSRLGVDSIDIVEIAKRLEANLRIDVDPMIAWDHPTINDMADALSKQCQKPSGR